MQRTHSPDGAGIASALALSLCLCSIAAPPAAAQDTAITIAHYTDADWLYDTYAARFGETREHASVDMRMFANGFALLHALGEDLGPSIEAFRADMDASYRDMIEMKQRAASGQLTPEEAPWLVPLAPVDPAQANEAQRPPEPSDIRARDARLRIVDKYHLPYRIEGMTDQWIIIPGYRNPIDRLLSPEEFTGNPQSLNSPAPSPWRWDLGPADVIWADGSSMSGIIGHVALVLYPGERGTFGNTDPTLVDANTPGVLQHGDMDEWAKHYSELRAFKPRLSWDGARVIKAGNCVYRYGESRPCSDAGTVRRLWIAAFAGWQTGKPYNWTFNNPGDQSRYYCTSLIWQAYKYQGINVVAPKVIGYNDIIYPKDFLQSEALQRFALPAAQ